MEGALTFKKIAIAESNGSTLLKIYPHSIKYSSETSVQKKRSEDGK